MNKWIDKGIRQLQKKLDAKIKIWDEVIPESESAPPYHSLSPISNADVTHYTKALTWALDNAKTEDIYNIALTGPYGSGKSSILKTFQKQNTNNRNVFLEISLATFKEEADTLEKTKKTKPLPVEGQEEEIDDNLEQSKTVKKSEDVLRLIELSILQQIFYHEEDSKIPDSRFKKIKSFKRKNMVWVTIGIVTALLFGFNFFYPDKIQSLLKISFISIVSVILRWLSFVVFLASLSIVIFRSLRLIYGLQVSKFKFHEAEIEIDENISKSILNNHLDEILYFFEVTDYSVVLIEDLDRFRQAEIFTKLRELNLLINKSKKVKQDVIFIYAVRDEIFRDKERTKFFDFIIPVIPVINASNSNETLATIVTDNEYFISNDLVEDISLFIDDMRLLYNITNEYHLYHNLLDKELDQNKLLAIIVYKNIYPEDFVLLAEEKGKLFELLNSRKTYVQKAITTIDTKISAHKAEIKAIEKHIIKNESELRMLYIGTYVDEIKGFDGFIIQGTARTLQEIAGDQDLFDYLINDDVNYGVFYTQYSTYYRRTDSTTIKFDKIEKKVNPDLGFDDRMNLIIGHSEDRLEDLKQDIQVLEKEKVTARHLKIKALLSDRSLNIIIDKETRQGQLFSVLLKSGYINEDYLDYISLFYEGSITKEDRSFLLNVKGQTGLDYDFNLTKIDNLIGKIRIVDFGESYILNYNLVDHLLENEVYANQLNTLFEQLNDSTEHGPGFIAGFLTNGTNIEQFINKIVSKWSGIWKFIDTTSDYTKERKEEYLKLILRHAAIEDIKKVAEESKLYMKIALTEGFLTLIGDDDKTQEIIKALQIKFFNLDFGSGSANLTKFVYEGNYYQITTQMIEKVIKQTGKFNRSEFDSANYDAIKKSESTFLIKYIEDNIDSYINNVYLSLPDNHKEPETRLITLLNNEKIKLENRIKLINAVHTKIEDLSFIHVEGMREPLLANNKVEPTWENLTTYYASEQIFSPELISFLNNVENAAALSTEEIDRDNLEMDGEIVDAFILSLINEPLISDDNYKVLLESVPGVFNIEDIGELSYEKMELLIESYSIGTLAENFAKVKSDYADLQHPLLETTPENFVDYISEYDIDGDDLLYVFKSAKFTLEQKNTIINTVDSSLIVKNIRLLSVITRLIFDNEPFDVPKEILMAALTVSLSADDRIKLFNMRYRLFAKAEIPIIFKTFPYPFSDIGVLHKSPVIPFSQENTYLANNLKSQNWIASVKDEKRGKRIINFKK